MIGESFTVVFKTTKSAFGENFKHMQMVVVVTLVLLLMTLLMCGIVDDVAGVVVDGGKASSWIAASAPFHPPGSHSVGWGSA